MRRFTMITCLLVLAGLAATTAWAQNPHYIRLNPSISSQTFCYNVALKEAGLGGAGVQSVSYSLSATATFTAGCFTKNGNQIQGQPKSGSGNATQTTVLPVRNGSTSGTVSLCPAAFTLPDPGCTGNQVLRILSASYTSVVLSDGLEGAGAGDQPLPSLSAP